MASEFLKRKAEERAKIIDQKYGKGAYGSTADLNKKRAEAKKETSKSSSTKSGGAKTEKSQASSVGSKVGSILGKTTAPTINYSSAINLGLGPISKEKTIELVNSGQVTIDNNKFKWKNEPIKSTTTTIKSDIPEKERKARITQIDIELGECSRALSGISRAKAYGTNNALNTQEKNIKKRMSELEAEKKKLQRVGTFTSSEMKQFEIDDLKAKKNSLPTYNPTARIAPSGVETYKNNLAAHSALDKEINRLEREKAVLVNVERLDKLNAYTKQITSKSDFKAGSKYSPAKPKTAKELQAEGYKQAQDGSWYKNSLFGGTFYAGEDSDIYVYINDPSKRATIGANKRKESSKASTAFGGGAPSGGTDTYEMMGYHTLTDDEKGAFNYLYHQDRKNGTNKAMEYLNKISPMLQERAMKQEEERYKALSKDSPILMSALSLGTNLQNAAMFPAKAAATATGVYDEMPLLDMYGNRTTAIRGAVSEDMGDWGKLFYNAGMSIGDMGVAMLAGGGNAKAIQAVMSSAAGSSTISEAKKNGASDGKALVLGLGSAAIEWATEKYSVEAILKQPKSILGFVATNTFTEATEEGASNISNIALDAIVSEVFGERNELEQRIDYLVLYEGKSEEEALKIAVNEKLQSLGEDILVGGLTGLGMSGTKATTIAAHNAYKNAQTQRDVLDTYTKDTKSLKALVDSGKASGEGTVSDKIAKEVEQAKESGKVTRNHVKSLIAANEVYIQEEAETEASQSTGNTRDEKIKDRISNMEDTSETDLVTSNNSERTIGEITDRTKKVLSGEKAVGVANGQAYVSDGKIFIPVNDVNSAKAEFGATESEKLGKNVSKLLEQSSFAPIIDNSVDGTLKGIGAVRVFTDVNGREIALKQEVAEYLEGYNLEATFRGGKPYAIKATDNEGNIAGVAMAIGMKTSGLKYELSDAKTVGKSNIPYNVMSNENPLLQERMAREAYIQKATGFGKYGVQAFADIMETLPESEAPVVAKAFQAAYEAGLTNLDIAQVSLPTNVHHLAFNAGKQDYIMENVGKVENVKNVKSHGDEAGFDSTNVPSSVSQQAVDIFDRFCKELGVVARMTGESDDFNANITPNVGVVQVASNFTVMEHLGKDAASLSFLTHGLHEVADHRAEELAPTEYAEFKREMYKYKNSLPGVSLADSKRKAYDERGVDISLSEAMSEVTANSILELYDNDLNLLAKGLDRVLNGTNAKAKKGANIFKQALDYVIDKFNKFLDKLGVERKSTYKESLNEITRIRDLFEKALGAAIAKNKEIAKTNLVTEKDGTVFDSDGNVVAQINEDGTATFSLKTFDDTGRAELNKWLDKNVKNKKLTETEANDIKEQLEYYYDICKQYEDKYAPFSAWSKAEVEKGLDGKPLMSVVKANSDYKMNLDFSLVCKKRRPLDALYRAMIDDGFMDNIGQLSEIEVAKINEIIRKNGFETACTLCFVDSKRYRQYAVADAFVSKYNELVKMLAPEGAKIDRFDFSGKREASADGLHTMSNEELKAGINKLNKVIKEHGETTVVGKIAKHLKAVARDRKLVMVSDFMDSEGFVRVKKANPDVFKLYNSSKGSGGPKATLPDVQYLGEILKRSNFTPKKAYAVGGVRVQSFSDYIARLVFDYLQMTADLSAKKLPAHAYSKEDIFVMQFGKTGIKINMSLVPAVAKDGIAPGLDKNGNYVWVDGHTFASDFHDKGSGQRGFELAVKIQNTEGYSQNCGTIAVGVSNEHIVKLLKDNDIRMVIPYHKSSLNHFVAKMGNIDQYKDYTNVQNTRDKATGKKIEGKDFNFNEAFHRLGDAKAATQEYLAWCEKNNYLPKFDEFAFHEDAEVRENYYKVLIDFAAYDSEGNATPQGPVTMNFPTENDAFGSMKSLIEKGLEADAILEGRKTENIPKILKEVKEALGTEAKGKRFSLKDTNLIQTDVDAIQAISNKKGEISVNDFSSEDIKSARNWAKKFYSELGNKSPFFRAWFGDWRANDKTKVSVVYADKKTGKNPRGVFTNKDTGWSINSSSVGYDETVSHSGKDKLSLVAMRSIDEIIKNAILLDTEVSSHGRGKKSIYTAFMHKFYAYVVINGKPCIAKMAVDESYAPKQSDTNKKFYHVRAIKIEPVTSVGIGFNHIPIMDGTGSNITVSELFNFVKTFDEKFNPKESSKIVNDDGTPKVMYHGSKNKFSVFNKGEKTGWLGKGIYFSDNKKYARENGKNVVEVYLNAKKPFVVNGNAPSDLITQIKELYPEADLFNVSDVLSKNGYDAIILNHWDHGEIISVFGENQIKSATENIGTFDNGNNDINYSLKGTEKDVSLKDVPKVRKAITDKRADVLAKYVDSGAISTEVYNQLIEEFGAIPKGENPHRDVSVPSKTAEDKKVSQTVRTILEAEATPDEAVPTIEKMVEDGMFSYDVYTDQEAIENGEDYIKEHGWEQSLIDWFDAVNKGEVSKDTTTTGWILYNHAANSGNAKTALMILDAMVRHQRSAAQALQATRILKKLSPETQLYGVQKSVSAFQNELKEKYGKKAPDLEIDEELAEQFLNAETQEERDAVIREIYKDIGIQMTSNWLDKWNAWRYLAMLGNPRTHIRNIAGNAFFAPVVLTKDLFATPIEYFAHKASRGKMQRSKSILWGSKSDIALLQAAWNDYANVADLVSNGGKYNDYTAVNARSEIEEGRKIFKSKLFAPVEWARKGNSKLLEVEDIWFSKPHYAYALAQYCKANNITAEQIAKGKAIAPAREYAIKEAQKATYKDTNGFSQMVSEWGRNRSEKNAVKRAFNIVVEGVLPFRKTPANILVRGVEYSPLGLLKGLTRDLYKVAKGEMNAHEAIDNISAGLTGTGLLALGIYLAAEGLIRGHGEDEEDERKFKEMQGHQSYSLELPDGTSITLDWLAPEALPFFVGVNLWESTQGSKEETNLSAMLKSVSNITEPMLEMSCLQGLNDLIEGVGNAASNETSGLMAILSSAVTSYLTQGIPTLAGQIERTKEEERMTTYTEKNGFLTGDMQYILGKASAKIPGWDYAQIPYIDAWGRREASGTALKRGLSNFLNPAYTSEIASSETEKELLRLYEQTGDASVFPERADKSFTVDGEDKHLTGAEYVKYAELKGQKSYKLITELLESDAYKSLDDEGKVRAIKDAYDYANQKAKEAISNYKPQAWVSKADEFGEAENYITFRAVLKETENSHKDNGEKFTKADYVEIVTDMAETDDEAWKMYLAEYDSEADIKAEEFDIDPVVYMTARIEMSNIKADYIYNGERVDGNSLTDEQRKNAKQVKNSRKEKIVSYLNSVCDNEKDYLYLLGIEYSSITDDDYYVNYFGK